MDRVNPHNSREIIVKYWESGNHTITEDGAASISLPASSPNSGYFGVVEESHS